MLSFGIPPSLKYKKVTVSPSCAIALSPWRVEGFLTSGVSLGEVISHKSITTDASLSGWGATHEGRTAQGLWPLEMRGRHINYLVLMAILLALKHFEPLILHCHVLIRTDNTTALFYVNKQGGLSSLPLDRLARELTVWCVSRLKSIRAVHVPGLLNGGADLLSRGGPRYEDWSLHPRVADQIFRKFGQPVADLFASAENSKCPLFYAVKGSPPLGLDAFTHTWPRGLLYAFPPFDLIRPTLERVRRFGLEMLLVAPYKGTWRSAVAPLLCEPGWQLPQYRDLLSQAKGEIFHQDPQALDLWVWHVKG